MNLDLEPMEKVFKSFRHSYTRVTPNGDELGLFLSCLLAFLCNSIVII